MNTPTIRSEEQKKALKIMLVNARHSATIGWILLVLPLVFVFANVFKYELGIDLGFLSNFVAWISSLDRSPGVNWLVRFLLVGGPGIAILLNLFAIAHMHHDKELGELVVTLKIRWVNLSILILCLAILAIFALYLLVENVG